jgi:phosphohistidine phosphatase
LLAARVRRHYRFRLGYPRTTATARVADKHTTHSGGMRIQIPIEEGKVLKLYLVQHGEACAKADHPDRPLTARGEQDVDRLAGFLQRAGVRVERVIHSGKLRARQTAMRLAAVLGPGVTLEVSGLINPNDNPKAFDWQSESWDRDALVVGHLPFMAKLVSHLVIGDENRPIAAYQPGTVVCLSLNTDAQWLIEWMVRPELLT